jgi:hypothetical protein
MTDAPTLCGTDLAAYSFLVRIRAYHPPCQKTGASRRPAPQTSLKEPR